MTLLEQRHGRSLGGRNPPPDPGLVAGRQKRRRRHRRRAAHFGITEEGEVEVANIFLGGHAMGWWGRVSAEAVFVVKRIFGSGKNDM